MITVHVDPCPTCQGSGDIGISPQYLADGDPTCSACDGRGWQIPEWINVRDLVSDCSSAQCSAPPDGWFTCRPSGRACFWTISGVKPGAFVTFTADCCEVHWPYGDPCPCGEHEVVVAERVIADIYEVVADILAPIPPHAHVRVNGPKAWLTTPITGGGWQHTSLDVDCTPGDMLARLEKP